MTTPSAPTGATVRPSRTLWLALLVLAVGIGIGAAITAVVVSGDDEQASESSAVQLTQVQASCRGWMGSSSGTASDDQWCTDMFTWMDDESGDSMMGSMMWGDPERMRAACRDWVEQNRAATGPTGGRRCDAMVDWMDEHMSGQRGSWMMQDR